MSTNKLYIIVKHAGESSFTYYWEEDPKIGKIHFTHSAFFTSTGKEICQPFYIEAELDIANKDLAKLNELNPVGDYALCELDPATMN